jgi:hypothetical protein
MIHQHVVNPLPRISKKQVHNTLSKPIIRPWEEIIYNKNRTRLGYDKEVTFHNPDYSKPIKFQSFGFIQEASTSLVPVQDQSDKCQLCNQVGHKVFKHKFVSADTDQSLQTHLDLEQTVTEYYSFPSSKVLNGQEKKDDLLTL